MGLYGIGCFALGVLVGVFLGVALGLMLAGYIINHNEKDL